MAYVDIDSGTVLNGPVVWVADDRITEDMTDDDVRLLAMEEPKDQGEFAARTVSHLRDLDYAVVVFTPDEVDGVDIDHLEEALVCRGWDYIDMNKEN